MHLKIVLTKLLDIVLWISAHWEQDVLQKKISNNIVGKIYTKANRCGGLFFFCFCTLSNVPSELQSTASMYQYNAIVI